MRIGYACLTLGVKNTNFKNCMLKNANTVKLTELIENNLNSLENIISYNIENNIKLFRISSDIIPFASSPAVNFPWQEHFANKLKMLGEKAKQGGIRLSMHPGQYTVLNSPRLEVMQNAIEDLNYHCNLLDSMGTGEDNKIILHVGGLYQNKKESMHRFILHYEYLNESVKKRLVLENDDTSYHIEDVLEIGTRLKIPVVFDTLHHTINSCGGQKGIYDYIKECKKTWTEKDGRQKIHYSQQNLNKRIGSHSATIKIIDFMNFYQNLDDKNIDVMLEVKDKNLSAVKCINSITDNGKIKSLESEWSKYKYSVLEKSPQNYIKIRELLKDKKEYPTIDFYSLVDEAMEQQITKGFCINAALHIWGYFKNISSEKEKNSFFKMLDDYNQGVKTIDTIKHFLWKVAIKYDLRYLLESYYFIL